ncbi:hypothetical protein [Paraburkholderia sp. BL21I4N1]|uniref:hypothetical protein n=1 Tax=Paraburkholderia sp. BL21I4N1 TaxID=1938801 RepID=UPI000CFD1BAD|nr:hypothetical protein [Paraburkholderia sp. BL21I4N1]PQV50804.1 hypothetical protein B0G83_105163 [Paraburkholderia sp. BL21I4N1]
MSLRQPRAFLSRDAAPSRLPAGQLAMHDLGAHTAIVAVEGSLRLQLRDRSLAWLGDAVPVTTITLQEGECFVTPQRGVVSINAGQTQAAVFVLQRLRSQNSLYDLIRHARQSLAGLVKTWWRRTA